MKNRSLRAAFTLIEMLVVITIIAILAVVVVLTLNPTQLLEQSRDAIRLSDMATITSALNLYSDDQGGSATFSLGLASDSYISVPDASATSTAGDQCQTLGLSSLPSSYAYHCGESSTLRAANGTGWLPVNFSTISSGAPLAAVPIDPINQTSSGLYYIYNASGTQYQLTTRFESQKYTPLEAQSGGSDPTVYTVGNDLTLAAYTGGLVSWWPLDEGSGSTAIDASGYGNNGTWNGTAEGTGGTYYEAGHNQTYAGYFYASADNYVILPAESFGDMTVCAWFNTTSEGVGTNHYQYMEMISSEVPGLANDWGFGIDNSGHLGFGDGGAADIAFSSSGAVNNGTWTFGCATRVKSTGLITLYVNGAAAGGGTGNSGNILTGNSRILFGNSDDSPDIPYDGLLQGMRIYERALSATTIAGLYSAGK